MNVRKLKEAEEAFLQKYPGGFANPEMLKLAKKHKTEKMIQMAQDSFAKEKFQPAQKTKGENAINAIIQSMIQMVGRSSMVSLFEKPKFRDYANSLAAPEREALVTGLQKTLYPKDEAEFEDGFEMTAEILRKGKLAKWSLVSVCPFYFHPHTEVFMKPTTVKGVISYFELEGLIYKPAPSFSFYRKYREGINQMKEMVDPSLSPDNAHFSGFLMMTMAQ